MKKISLDFALLGSLLLYYRQEKGISRKDLLKLSNGYFSYATIRRIENGGYASFDNYLKEIELLDLKFSNSDNDYIELNSLIEETYSIINSGKCLSEYILLNKRIRKFVNTHINELYIVELAKLCIDVIEMYLSCKKTDEKIIKISEACFVKSSDIKVKELSSFLLFMYSINYLRSDSNYNNYINYYNNISNKQILLLNAPFYDFNTMCVLDVFKKYNSLYENNPTNNPLDTYIFNFIKAYCYSYVENFTEAKKCIDEITKIKDITSIVPGGSLMHFYKTKGYIQYKLANYKDGFDSLKKVYELSERSLEISYAFLFKSAELTNNTEFILKVLKDDKTNSKIVETIFEYYKNKYINDFNDVQLSEFIIKNFSKNICNSKVCCRFFLDELFELVDDTKQYKQYYKFLLSLKQQYVLKNNDFIFD